MLVEPKDIVFDLFRFQLVPVSTSQLNLFGENLTNEQLIERKNTFFSEVANNNKEYLNRQREALPFKVLFSEGDLVVIRLAAKKGKIIQDKDFSKKEVEDYPDVYIVINNDPSTQKIAISKNNKAFSSSFVVAHILEKSYGRLLNNFGLAIYIKPIFDQKIFWNIVDQYEGRLQAIKFELIKPNLANISGAFKKEIRTFSDNTNSHTTRLELNAPDESSLENINEDNQDLKGLIQYASEGGGEVSVKARGIKRLIKTKKSVKETVIKDIEIQGAPELVKEIFKSIVEA